MVTIRSIFGYGWAIACMLLVPALFFGFGYWPQALVRVGGLHVSPWYQGGVIRSTLDNGGYQTVLREPVFQGIFSERKDGFFQVEWIPAENSLLPKTLVERADVDGDGIPDLEVKVDSGTLHSEITAMKPWVKDIETTVRDGKEIIVRIGLRNFHLVK
jgi:hypothetical protein